MKLESCGVYMDSEVFTVFSLYASKKQPRKAYGVWADALTSYMENNPLDCMVVQLQQIADELPSRRDVLRMETLFENIKFVVSRFEALGDVDSFRLRERLIQLLMKGTEIKHPSEEFVKLMEKAMKYVKK